MRIYSRNFSRKVFGCQIFFPRILFKEAGGNIDKPYASLLKSGNSYVNIYNVGTQW